MTVLQARRINLGYRQKDGQFKRILQDFDLQLSQGQLVTLLGPSGVGKSSLLRVLAGLQRPESGEVSLFDQAIVKPHPRLAFVFQNPSLLPWLNVRENVGFGMRFKDQPKISKDEAEKRITEALADVDLAHAGGLYPSELSGCMAQRVALARALARQPQIILLDEPFSALDEITRTQMQGLLTRLIDKHQAAAVLVTHDIDEALLVSQRIVLIGKMPGRTIGEWTIHRQGQGEEALLQLQQERADILRTLQSAKGQQLQTATVDFVI